MSRATAFRGRTHVTRTRVRFGETDAAGIVFYPTFFVWFDVGTHGLMRGAGATRDAAGRPDPMLPIVESGAEFSAPLRSDDPIAIHSRVVEIGHSSLRVEHVVFHQEAEVARGFEVRVMVRRDGDRIVPAAISQTMRTGLAEAGIATEDDLA